MTDTGRAPLRFFVFPARCVSSRSSSRLARLAAQAHQAFDPGGRIVDAALRTRSRPRRSGRRKARAATEWCLINLRLRDGTFGNFRFALDEFS